MICEFTQILLAAENGQDHNMLIWLNAQRNARQLQLTQIPNTLAKTQLSMKNYHYTHKIIHTFYSQ